MEYLFGFLISNEKPRSRVGAKESNKKREQPLQEELASKNQGRPSQDRTARINWSDVDGVSFLESPRACIGKLLFCGTLEIWVLS